MKKKKRKPSPRAKAPSRKPARAAAARRKPRPPEREGYHLPARTEAEQLAGLGEDLLDAWAKLRGFVTGLGEQEIRTSHRSIMFARKTCHAFVRPRKTSLEVTFFLLRALDAPEIQSVKAVSRTKFAHVARVVHADQVESPLTDWIAEAFELAG